jgi:class 3 adenylate cyclase
MQPAHTAGEVAARPHRAEVTFLIADITGFSRLAEIAEPEVILSVVTDWHATVGEVAREFGGTVLDHRGDDVSVVFNDPRALPDHEQCAIRAAFELRRRLDPLNARWREVGYSAGLKEGLHSGHATMGMVGPPDARRYGTVGRAIVLASRCASNALAGQTLITQRVLGAVEDIVDVEPAGAITRGLDRPVPVFNVVRLRT